MSAFATMMPRLEAEEQLDAVRTAALAAGAYSQDDSQKILAALEQQRLGADQPEARREAASPEKLAGIGLGGIVAPPAEPGADPVEGFEFRKGGAA